MSEYLNMFFVKKVATYIYTFFLIACTHLGSLVFAMEPNPENAYALSLLWQYAESDDNLLALEDLLNENPSLDINLPNNKQQTVLHIAVLHGATSILTYLLKLPNHKRIKPNDYDKNYVSQLKINVDAQDSFGCTPLIYAINKGNRVAVEVLLAAGVKIDNLYPGNGNVLHYVANYKSPLLIDNSKSFIISCNKEFVEFIINEIRKKAGAQFNIDSPDSRGYTPLMIAVKTNNRAAVEAFLQAGAQVNKIDPKGQNVFHYVACDKVTDKKIIELLIQASKAILLDVNAIDNYKQTPLIYAAVWFKITAVEILLKAGASAQGININNSFRTPLYQLIDLILSMLRDDVLEKEELQQYKKIIRLLLKAGANMHAVEVQDVRLNFAVSSDSQRTPLRLAFDFARAFPSGVGSCAILIELLSWYLYQICTDSARPEDAAEFRLLKNKYMHSPKFQTLRAVNPLLKWIFIELIDCTSKTQLIEKIAEYLKSADEEKQRIMLENMGCFLLKEEVLEELIQKKALSLRFIKKS